MIAIPPFILFIPYALIMLGMAFFSLVNIVNLLRYGARNVVGFLATFLYLSGAAIILFFTWQYLPQIDWTEPIQLIAVNPKLF